MFRLIKIFFRFIGLEISFLSRKTKPRYDFFLLLQYFNVNLIFDIGANVGQFGAEMREVGYDGRIISFEPLPEAHKALIIKSQNDKNWDVYEQCAIGNENGIVEINISGNSVSSSILPMAKAHSNASASSAYVDKVKVPLKKLDTISKDYSLNEKKYFIKIDTQGFEWQVLDGATELLDNAIGIQVELSLVHLYDGQKLWIEVIQRLEKAGFVLWKIQPGFTDPRDGRLLQCDGTFINIKKNSKG